MIPSLLLAASFKLRSLCSSHDLIATNFLFDYLDCQKIIHENVFYNVSLGNLENVLQKNLRKAESGNAFLEYLEAQILKIYLLGANHGNATVGSMFVLVCPKKL